MPNNPEQTERLRALADHLETASRSSKLGSVVMTAGLLFTLLAAGLAIYNTTVLRAELDQARAQLERCQSGGDSCGTTRPAAEAAAGETTNPPAPVDLASNAGVATGLGTGLAAEEAAETSATKSDNECRRDVEPIQYAICSDPEMKRLSRSFWTEWNQVKAKLQPQRVTRLEARLDRRLMALIERCNVPRTPPVDTEAMSKSLPCLREGYAQRSEWLERTVDG